MLIRLLILVFITAFSFSSLVGNITISGNKNVLSEEILSRLLSTPGSEFITNNVLDDISNIYEMGVFRDNISAETLVNTKGNTDLIFFVEENPLVKKIFFVGVHTFKPSHILASLNVKEGKLLSYNDLRKDIPLLTNFYHEKGYALMSVKEIIEPNGDDILTFVVKEGMIEDIIFKGLSYTKEYVVTREMQTEIDTAFNVNVVRKDIRNIHNTGFFEDINVEPPVPGIHPDRIVLVLNVKEKRATSLQFGGGVGSVAGFFGFVKVESMNFMGDGYNVSVKGQWGETQGTYELKYSNPWFFADKTSLSARLWSTDGLVDEGQGLNAISTGGELTIGKPLADNIRGSITARINRVIPAEALIHKSQTITDYTIRSIGAGVNYDSRDYAFNPTEGDYISARANASLKFLGATIEFMKYGLKYYKYFPLGEDLALGLKSSFDDALGTIFDTERYFAGGATTVRGYQDGYPFAIGARRAMGTVELRYALNESMQIYTFFDFGKVGIGSADANFYGDSSWRSGKGVGFKLSTPIGPLRFDYAWGDGASYHDGMDSSKGVVHFNIENLF